MIQQEKGGTSENEREKGTLTFGKEERNFNQKISSNIFKIKLDRKKEEICPNPSHIKQYTKFKSQSIEERNCKNVILHHDSNSNER